MSKINQNKTVQNYTGLGLVFGGGIGLAFGLVILGDVSLGLVLGSGIGLVFGAALGKNSTNDRGIRSIK
jgi:hypothetical protein